MKTEDAKALADALKELNESYEELLQTMKETTRETKAAKNLWRKGKSSRLIKIGLALIAFPDPTISDIIGSALVAAGMVQEGIRRRTIYVEDVYKTFQNNLKKFGTLGKAFKDSSLWSNFIFAACYMHNIFRGK